MKKYLVYLTKSREVAYKLSKTFELGRDGAECVGYGSSNSPEIPAVYHDQKYFWCIVTYTEDAPVEPYRLVIA